MTDRAKGRKPQAARREESETRLLETAVTLIAERGYDGFSLAELGQRASYSRGLPFHYFGTKAKLLTTVAQRIIDDFMHPREEEPIASSLDALENIVWRYVNAALDRKPKTKALHSIVGAALISEELQQSVRQLNDVGRATVRAHLQRGMADGDIRGDIDVDAEALIYTSFLRGVVLFYLIDEAVDIEGAARTFSSNLRERLSARKN